MKEGHLPPTKTNRHYNDDDDKEDIEINEGNDDHQNNNTTNITASDEGETTIRETELNQTTNHVMKVRSSILLKQNHHHHHNKMRIPTLRGLGKNDRPNKSIRVTNKDSIGGTTVISTLRGLGKNPNNKTTRTRNPVFIPIERDIDIVVNPTMETMMDDEDECDDDNNNNSNNDISRTLPKPSQNVCPFYISYLDDDNKDRPYISYLDDSNQNENENDNDFNGANNEERLYATTLGVQPDLLGRTRMGRQDEGHTEEDSDRGEQQQYTPALLDPTSLPNLDNSSDDRDGLVEAMPVSASFNRSSTRMTAQPVNQANLDRQTARVAKEKKHKRIACAVVVLAFLVLMVSLAVRLTKKNKSSNAVLDDNHTPTPSPTRPLPPMQNLELLYDELPDKTKESLYSIASPQYQAWEWLLNHPNITAYPTWRKKQIFAMATIFYSMEGPNWPEETPGRSRWMNASTSECDWILSDHELAYYIQEITKVVGPDAYEEQDYQPCNQDGELQTLVLNRLYLPITNTTPKMPPELGLLTSLKLLAVMFSQINARLSDLLIPELMQLPNLQGLNYRDNGAHGTIPKQIGLLTCLRHLLIGASALTGTIPTQFAGMTSLEYVSLGDEENLKGKLPSELGLMTSLTDLGIFRSSFTGTIPTELGSLSRLRRLSLDENQLTGAIPSQLGLLTSNTWLEFFENRLNGFIPTELGLMTSTTRLLIWNNALTGSLPSQLGLMPNIVDFRVGNDLKRTSPNNDFLGSLPSELWELSHLQWLYIPNLPNLHGRIPTEIMMPNLTILSLSGSPNLSGTIPESICFIEELDFDCSDLLCGCDCECGAAGMVNNSGM